MLEYDEPQYSEDEIADACVDAGISDSIFESLMCYLERNRKTPQELEEANDKPI